MNWYFKTFLIGLVIGEVLWVGLFPLLFIGEYSAMTHAFPNYHGHWYVPLMKMGVVTAVWWTFSQWHIRRVRSN